MKTHRLLIIAACAGVLGACAATLPSELVSAREAYRRASTGPAAQAAPAEVHVAAVALAKAENSFLETEGSYKTRDLAYVAERKAQLAEVTASIASQQKSQALSKDEYVDAQGRIVTRTKEALANSTQQLSAEQDARLAADKRAADAQAALAKLAAVKEEARGLVITLSGSVLFASNQSVLLPAAQERLNQVADVLLSTRERNVLVEGYTDSRGSDSANMVLSQARADSVRSYLVQRGYESDLIRAQGLGEGSPVADNESAEGRANNRRVQIIIERAQTTSSR